MKWAPVTRCRALLATSTNLVYFFKRSGSHHDYGISYCEGFGFGERNRRTNKQINQFQSGAPSFVYGSTFQRPSSSSLFHCSRSQERFPHHSHSVGNPLGESIDEHPIQHHDARSRAEDGFSLLARQGRTWRRLSHLVDMAILSEYTSSSANTMTAQHNNSAPTKPTIADIGTDHGLLAVGLALTGRFDKVIGVDVSDLALTNGAFSLIKRVRSLGPDHLKPSNISTGRDRTSELPVEFRLGNGLKMLGQGEADCVCIAGMGVHRMIEILGSISEEGIPDDGNVTDLARIGCQQLILQPNNSRPLNLILLYDALQRDGWRLVDERIEKLSCRWYLTSCFRKHDADSCDVDNLDPQEGNDNSSPRDLPGSKIIGQDTDGGTMRTVLEEYIDFHRQWIRQDASNSNKSLHPDDQRWLDFFVPDNSKTF